MTTDKFIAFYFTLLYHNTNVEGYIMSSYYKPHSRHKTEDDKY